MPLLRSVASRIPVRDALLALVLAAGAVAQLVADDAAAPDALIVSGTLCGCLLVAGRRTWPLATAAAFAALFAGTELVRSGSGLDSVALFVAVLVIAYSAGAHAPARRSAIALACLLASEVAVVVDRGGDEGSDYAAGLIVNVVVWSVGVAVGRGRTRAAGLERHLAVVEREVDRRERRSAELERARIARELHDVIAHSVTLMTVQAGAGESVLERDPEQARAAFRAVQETGRRTVEDLRGLLAVLREVDGDHGAPEPRLAEIGALAERMSSAGLSVEVEVRGEPVAISPGLDATAYRIVQEGLTNALRHAGAERVTVLVSFDPGRLELVVADDGVGTPADGNGGGHGLVGMRERAAVFGGELTAGPAPSGGFEVRARLPLAAR